MKSRRRVFRLVLAVSCGMMAWAAATAPAKKVDFDRDIRPILSDTCFACHGPDERQRMAKLRLDTPDDAARMIVPGDPGKSKLYQRISEKNVALRMPPPHAERKLTDGQVDTIRRWIEEGAVWKSHWAYQTPRRPEVPAAKDAKWVRNPIDAFVLSRLEKEGLKPSAEADRVTLIRRLTFDLTGLPPTPSEVDAYLADKSPDAYEKQVDRLLASPRYGERMAMMWLDLARYADTHGYHIDSHREMWHWRDWLIQAFNSNMPYDEFTVEQIAGDLLPNPTRDQLIATGFNRNHMINFEGGAIPEEYQTEYVVDRVEATANTFMAMTMGCARCHDHKYDPIKQRDFYRFFAFFNTVAEKGLDGRTGNAEPLLQLTEGDQEAELKRLKAEIKEHEETLKGEAVAAAQEAWEKSRADSLPQASRQGLAAHYELDGNLADVSGHYRAGRALRGNVIFGLGAAGKSATFDGEVHVELTATADFARGPFTIAAWMNPSGQKAMSVLQKRDGARGLEIAVDDPFVLPKLRRGRHVWVKLMSGEERGIEVKTREPIVSGEWHALVVSYDGSSKAAGVTLYWDGKPLALEVVRDTLAGDVANASPVEIGSKKYGNPYKGALTDLRLYDRVIGGGDAETLALHQPVRNLLWIPAATRTREQKDRLRTYFLKYDAPEQYGKLYAELTAAKERKEQLDDRIPTTMVMNEMEKPRETHILGRGDYRNKGEKVTPGVPAFLPPLPADAPPNRLGLARWLVDPSHPLTSRVAVNRFWQMYFGTGLVETAEDFGSQGATPSYPEMLDWLATEFIRTKWDVKAMQRLIVTSATYRQASKVTPDMLERDPQNRLLARGARFRLPAEMIRDSALAAGGLLNGDIGGASVFPYQPKGVWEDIAYGDVYSAQAYVLSHGRDLYRRSMYWFWKRTAPPPSLNTFDAPDREKCVARRARTNTPLQALVLMNDPQFVEAARAVAQRSILEAGRDPGARVRHAFRLITARKPGAKEVQALRDLAERETGEYRKNPEMAGKLLGVGESAADARIDKPELAAWTLVASAIMNLDEAVTKE